MWPARLIGTLACVYVERGSVCEPNVYVSVCVSVCVNLVR